MSPAWWRWSRPGTTAEGLDARADPAKTDPPEPPVPSSPPPARPADVAPRPTKRDCLARLARCGVEIDTVVDVGVYEGTPELLEAFPRVPHLLLEPLTTVLPRIEAAYAGVPHRLYNVACFDRDGEAWIIGRSADGSGVETHAHVSDTPGTPGTGDVVSCRSIRRARLDGLDLPLGQRVLLKVDVDGADLEVLKGAEGILDRVQVVLVEAPMPTLLARASWLASHGFRLHEVIDLAYYYDILHQVDLVFVREELYARLPGLTPWTHRPFSWEAYRDLSKRLEGG